LTRINQEHAAYPGAINAQGKQWAYALAALGQVDATVVADTPSYGVFCRGGTGSGCQGGTRTYVAYNAAASPITATFRDRATGTTVTSLSVPGSALATMSGNGTPLIDRLTPPATDSARLYLGKPATQPVNCGVDAAAQPLFLSHQPGVWLPPVSMFPFPSDSSQLDISLVCVPPRPTPNPPVGDDAPPAPAYVRTWQGTFSGARNADQLTRFALYANQALVPGWQQGVCVAGGAGLPASCPNHSSPGPKNSYILQVRYDFDNDGQDERVEQYRIVSPDTANTFTHDGKMTEYRADVLTPFHGDAPMELRCPRGEQFCGFPASIPANQPARLALDIWGFISPVGPVGEFPVYVSVNADPLTNRASWIRPPYNVQLGAPGPGSGQLRGKAEKAGSGRANGKVSMSGKLQNIQLPDLRLTMLTLQQLLFENATATELVRQSGQIRLLPLTLSPRQGGSALAAIYETASGVTPKVRVELKQRDVKKREIEWKLTAERVTIAEPQACVEAEEGSTNLRTRMIVISNTGTAIVLSAEQRWWCEDDTLRTP
jgi:hypothetical protein